MHSKIITVDGFRSDLMKLTTIEGKEGCLAHFQLDRPDQYNALNIELIQDLIEAFNWVEQANNIYAVVVSSSLEKAFCAGGDVKVIFDNAAKPELIRAYFETEYQLDQLIHRFKKPVIVWGSGIVMGGGMGLMQSASHRICTPKSRLAMPEVKIGLFPDVGGTWFLSRTPGMLGLFLGLTGVDVKGQSALYANLADYYLSEGDFNQLLDGLSMLNWKPGLDILTQHTNHLLVNALLNELSISHDFNLDAFYQRQNTIDELMSEKSVSLIETKLSEQAKKDEWFDIALSNLTDGCPLSAEIMFLQYHLGDKLSIEQVFEWELDLACLCVASPNFKEGVRALLIDKDNQPKWQPESRLGLTESVMQPYVEYLEKL